MARVCKGPECVSDISGLRSDANYCSPACKQSAYRERRGLALAAKGLTQVKGYVRRVAVATGLTRAENPPSYGSDGASP